jgi:hypothetical protein
MLFLINLGRGWARLMDLYDAWKINYKTMHAGQLSDEYQRLLSSYRHDPAFADKLNFLKLEFVIKTNMLLKQMVY